MVRPRQTPPVLVALAVLAALACAGTPVAAQGIVLPGVGPVNRSMAGAATAAPIDAAGAIHWNPGSISGLPRSEVVIGAELSYPDIRVSSQVAAGALGPGVPNRFLAGSNRSDSGLTPLPTVAFVYKPDDSPWTFGMGLFTVGGVSINVPGSLTNSVLTAPPPVGVGSGPIYSRLGVLQIAPTVAYQVTDAISVGLAPTITLAELQADPFAFAAPNINPSGFAVFPNGTHSRPRWGLGFQAGVYYTPTPAWGVGFSFKSPQWFETFEFNSTDGVDNPRHLAANFQYPMILSAGVAYRGIDRLLIAADLRWIDYDATEGFKESGFGPNGAVVGLGWKSVFSLSLGTQYQLSEALSLRGGYFVTDNPIPGSLTSLNLSAPALYRNAFYLGSSWQVNDSISLSACYLHALDATITGPILTPAGPVPDTSVSIRTRYDVFLAGVTVLF